MIAEHGEEAKTGADYIADVLQTAASRSLFRSSKKWKISSKMS